MAYRRIIAALLFSLALFGYLLNKPKHVTDHRWTVPVAHSIRYEQNVNLDEFHASLTPKNRYTTEQAGEHLYNFFPYPNSLFVLPVLTVFEHLPPSPTLFGERTAKRLQATSSGSERTLILRRQIDHFTAVLLCAGSVALIFLIATRYLTVMSSAVVALAFGFSTTVYSSLSTALWPNTSSVFLLTLALFFITDPQFNKRKSLITGLALGLAYACRPTNSVPLLFLSLYLLIKERRYFLHYLAGVLAVLAVFFLINLQIYDAILPSYFRPRRLAIHDQFFQALFGHWISPNRGLLVFCPVVVLSLYGMKGKKWNLFDYTLLAIIGVHWVAISAYYHWWGGFSFGPRLFSDMLPLFFYFLIPVFKRFEQSSGRKKLLPGVAFTILFATGFAINMRGAHCKGTTNWNYKRCSIDRCPEKVWDIKNLQFLERCNYK